MNESGGIEEGRVVEGVFGGGPVLEIRGLATLKRRGGRAGKDDQVFGKEGGEGFEVVYDGRFCV